MNTGQKASGGPLRAVFMGTPGFAAVILRHVLAYDGVAVTGVYTQPDRPAGRGKLMKEPEVKTLAKEHGLAVFQPPHFRDKTSVAELAAHEPDVLLVAAYGLILPPAVLAVPSIMPINVHASLLPKYRGAAPIQRAIMDGLPLTGVTIMRMEAGLDTGPILLQKAMGIDINDTSGMLHDDLAEAGGELLVDALNRLREGSLLSLPQDDALATHAAKLTKDDGVLDFSEDVARLHARIRGVTPWPGAVFSLHREGREPLFVHCEPGCYPFRENISFSGSPQPGDIGGVAGDALVIRCNDGWYAFTRLRAAGKKAVDGKAFFNGYLAGCPRAYAGPERL